MISLTGNMEVILEFHALSKKSHVDMSQFLFHHLVDLISSLTMHICVTLVTHLTNQQWMRQSRRHSLV